MRGMALDGDIPIDVDELRKTVVEQQQLIAKIMADIAPMCAALAVLTRKVEEMQLRTDQLLQQRALRNQSSQSKYSSVYDAALESFRMQKRSKERVQPGEIW